MTDTQQDNKTVVQAIDQDTLKRDIIEHLRRYHGSWYDPKASKQSMLDRHRRLHLLAEEGIDAVREDYLQERPDAHPAQVENAVASFRRGLPHMHPHVHVDAVVSSDAALEDLAEQLKDANVELPSKPLTATERKVLTDLVNNDFNRLMAESRAFAQEQLTAKLAAIDEDYDQRKDLLENAQGRVRELEAQHTRERAALVSDLSRSGVVVDGWLATKTPSFTIKGRDEEYKAAREAHQGLIRQISAQIEAQRLVTLRRILLASLTPEGRTFSESIPTAETVLQAAQVKMAEITAS